MTLPKILYTPNIWNTQTFHGGNVETSEYWEQVGETIGPGTTKVAMHNKAQFKRRISHVPNLIRELNLQPTSLIVWIRISRPGNKANKKRQNVLNE